MAVIKAVSSKQSIGGAIDYVKKEEKTEEKLLSGKDCDPLTVREEMQTTKELWGKTEGRTYKHYTQSFHKDENITYEQAHEIAKKWVEQCPQFKGFEVLIATHKDREHIHSHFIVNSVNFEDGHKLQISQMDLKQMKEISDNLCREYGLTITKKGKTFEGAEREETSAYTKETYQLLKKAEQGEVKSYVQDIALKIMDEREQAISREDFLRRMNERGVSVDWQDNHKYITFTDQEREAQGEKLCKIRNNKLEKYYNIDFGKEQLECEFEINARSKQTKQRAEQQLARADERQSVGTGARNTTDFLRELEAQERASEEKRDNKIAERENRDAERSRQRAEAERRAREQEQKARESKERSRRESHSRGWER